MKVRSGKTVIKKVLGEIPLTAELYWQYRQQGKPLSKSFSLQRTQKNLPVWISQAEAARAIALKHPGKKIFLFSTLRYWIEHSVLLSLALSGMGHQVTLAYLPVNNWRVRMNRFDLRRQDAYARSILQPAAKLIEPISILADLKDKLYWSEEDASVKSKNTIAAQLPAGLEKKITEVSNRDVQYTLQVEEVDPSSELYRLRMERNLHAARMAFMWLQANQPDVVLTPNGSILEMGAVYQAARYLELPVVTYEFGEQRDRIWLVKDDEIMLQHSDDLWSAWKATPLSESQQAQIRALYASRQNASLWENFSRRWQGLPSQGGAPVRSALALDDRPIVVLAANVIGDSLTLGRQVFSQNMTEWLQRTLRNFAQRPEAQLVVRIHPGERYTKGPSVADVIQAVMPELPANIHLVKADDPINTYDLLEIADLGLVYTTTVGMEMAMSGIPTIVSGQTHYRAKGFTLDPQNWEEYFELLNRYLSTGSRLANQPKKAGLTSEVVILPDSQVELAWQYAYRYFFDYPMSFPWHLLYFYDELADWPLERVISGEGLDVFGETFQCLAGAPRQWRKGQ